MTIGYQHSTHTYISLIDESEADNKLKPFVQSHDSDFDRQGSESSEATTPSVLNEL